MQQQNCHVRVDVHRVQAAIPVEKVQIHIKRVFLSISCGDYLIIGLVDGPVGYIFDGGLVKLHVLTPKYQL